MSPPPRHLPPPDLFSYQGPPNGDYVRYVEQLMAWAEQEHTRTGAYALGPQRPSTPTAPSASTTPGQPADIVRQVNAMLAQQAQGASGRSAKKLSALNTFGSPPQPPAAPKGLLQQPRVASGLFIAGLVALFIFQPDAAPLAIVLWVAWNVRRLFKAVSSKK